MNGYTIFLEKDGIILRMPTNPEEINIEEPQDFEDYDIIKLGPITVPGALGLRSYAFDVELPHKVNQYVVNPEEFKTPDVYINTFRAWRASSEPINMTIASENFKISESVVITSLDYTEKAGEEGDYYMKIKLKQYRPFNIEFIEQNAMNKAQLTARPGMPPLPANALYIVQAGDTLWRLAKKYLGKGEQYLEIAKANPHIGSNPNFIKVGQKLTISRGE